MSSIPEQLNTIRIDCNKQDLKDVPQYKAWLEQVKNYIAGRIDQSARLRMYAYERGATTFIALDLFCANREKDVTTTISITPGEAMLMLPIHEQLELSFPGIVEVLGFVGAILPSAIDSSGKFQLLPWACAAKV